MPDPVLAAGGYEDEWKRIPGFLVDNSKGKGKSVLAIKVVFQSMPEIPSFDFSSPLIKQFNFVPGDEFFHLLFGLCPSLFLLFLSADAIGKIHFNLLVWHVWI